MRSVLMVHIAAGMLALASGYVALAVRKGRGLHSRAGSVFAWAMIVMATTGLLVTVVDRIAVETNVPAALVTLYLATTGMLAFRADDRSAPKAAVAGTLVGGGITALCFATAGVFLVRGGRAAGFAWVLVLFGSMALAGAAGDWRLWRGLQLQRAARVRRHLWRMCFAMLIASLAFFGPPNRLPAGFRSPILRTAAGLIPLVAALWWLWRTRRRAGRSVPTVAVAGQAR
jgi:uncharacterized membrane protein